jgi:hypothetical protein
VTVTNCLENWPESVTWCRLILMLMLWSTEQNLLIYTVSIIDIFFFLSSRYIYIYIQWLICIARMDFSEQYCIKDEAWDLRCEEKSISSKTYQQGYVNFHFFMVTLLWPELMAFIFQCFGSFCTYFFCIFNNGSDFNDRYLMMMETLLLLVNIIIISSNM